MDSILDQQNSLAGARRRIGFERPVFRCDDEMEVPPFGGLAEAQNLYPGGSAFEATAEIDCLSVPRGLAETAFLVIGKPFAGNRLRIHDCRLQQEQKQSGQFQLGSMHSMLLRLFPSPNRQRR